MPIRALESRQRGSLYVEAAFSLPVFLGVLYATIFLSTLTFRQLSIQFIASKVSDTVRTCIQGTATTCDLASKKASWQELGTTQARTLIGSRSTPTVYVCSPYCEPDGSGKWRAGSTSTGKGLPGELYHVVITVNLPQLFGGTVPLFGLSENKVIEGSVLGTFERSSESRQRL
jgi:hypothetical protein